MLIGVWSYAHRDTPKGRRTHFLKSLRSQDSRLAAMGKASGGSVSFVVGQRLLSESGDGKLRGIGWHEDFPPQEAHVGTASVQETPVYPRHAKSWKRGRERGRERGRYVGREGGEGRDGERAGRGSRQKYGYMEKQTDRWLHLEHAQHGRSRASAAASEG